MARNRPDSLNAASAKMPLPRFYYASRARYYKQATAQGPAQHTLLRVDQPSDAHRNGLASLVLGSAA